MPRVKIYDAWELPGGVAKIAKAVCADYDRRAKALRTDAVIGEIRETYTRLNAAVDLALAEIDEPNVREEILRDMVVRRGYERSRTQTYLCKNSYYARRRMVTYLVAKALALV